MNNGTRVAVLAALVVAVATVVAVKQQPRDPVLTPPPAAPTTQALPRLVDLGADKCIPCKKMAPILEALKEDFVGVLEVEFIDVWKYPDAAEPYGIQLIPTQIFFDVDGNELFRHEGFFGREDILAVWADHGVKIAPAP